MRTPAVARAMASLASFRAPEGKGAFSVTPPPLPEESNERADMEAMAKVWAHPEDLRHLMQVGNGL